MDRTVPVEETWGALEEAVEVGKVRHPGVFEASAATISGAAAVHPVTAVQTEHSLWERSVETDGVLQAVRAAGAGFVACSPLGRGFLSGSLRSRDDLPEGVTSAQPALARVLSRGDDVVLSDDEPARVDDLAPVGVASGDRCADMSTVNA